MVITCDCYWQLETVALNCHSSYITDDILDCGPRIGKVEVILWAQLSQLCRPE